MNTYYYIDCRLTKTNHSIFYSDLILVLSLVCVFLCIKISLKFVTVQFNGSINEPRSIQLATSIEYYICYSFLFPFNFLVKSFLLSIESHSWFFAALTNNLLTKYSQYFNIEMEKPNRKHLFLYRFKKKKWTKNSNKNYLIKNTVSISIV